MVQICWLWPTALSTTSGFDEGWVTVCLEMADNIYSPPTHTTNSEILQTQIQFYYFLYMGDRFNIIFKKK